MRISNTQPSQGLFLNDQVVLSNESIRGSRPNNPPQLTIIKTDKTGHQEWSLLTKLALATAGIIKATALGYLAYTYKSTPPATPTAPTPPGTPNAPTPPATPTVPFERLDIPTSTPNTTPNNFKKIDDSFVQDILNSESASNSPMLPLFLGATVISLAIGGIFGFLMSKLKVDKAAFEDRILALNNRQERPIDPIDNDQEQIASEINQLKAEKAQLENRKKELEEQINQLSVNNSQSRTAALKQQEESQEQTKRILDIESAKREEIKLATQGLKTEQAQIKACLTAEIERLEASKRSIEEQVESAQQRSVAGSEKILAVQNELKQINISLAEKQEIEKNLIEKLNKLNQDFEESAAKLEETLRENTKSLNDELAVRTVEFRKKINESEELFAKRKSELENELSTLQNDINVKIENKKSIKEQLSKEVHEEEEKLRAKKLECEREISKLNTTFSQEINNLRDSVQRQKQELEEELKTKKEELLKESKKITDTENTKRSDYIAETQRIIDTAKTQYSEFESKVGNAKNQLDLVTKELEVRNLKLQQLQIEIQKIEAQKLQNSKKAVEENFNQTIPQKLSRDFIQIDKFKASCALNGQAVFCGVDSLPYKEMASSLKKNPGFKDVISIETLGLPFQSKKRTSDNRQIEKISHDEKSRIVSYKAALVNLVIENYKRKKERLKPIPAVFVVGLNEEQLNLPSLMESNSEIRALIKRAAKLCFDESIAQDIRAVANQTFVFISLFSNELDKNTLYDFKVNPTPWSLPQWKELEKMQNKSKVFKSISDSENPSWRNELSLILNKYSNKHLIDLHSFKSQCAPHGEVMIYGFESCLYNTIAPWLRKQNEFSDVLNGMNVGMLNGEIVTTSNNRKIERIRHANDLDKTNCTSALVNLVAENYKRNKENLNIIPTVFVVGRDNEQLDLVRVMDIESGAVTGAEIRRAAKLCYDETIPADIRDIAKKTFMFISLSSSDLGQKTLYDFKIIPKPWDDLQWEELKNQREKLKNQRKQTTELLPEANPTNPPWRSELINLITTYESAPNPQANAMVIK